AELELVRARARDGVDDAAGGAAELHRVAARLDLELLVKRVRHRGEADAVVEVRDVEAVDVDGVLRDRGAAEGDAIELALADAGREVRNRQQVALDRQPLELLTRDVRGDLRGAEVDRSDDARAQHLHDIELRA